MKTSRNLFLKSLTLLAYLGAAVPSINTVSMAADGVDVASAPVDSISSVVAISPLRTHLSVLRDSMDPAALKGSVVETISHLMTTNPLTNFDPALESVQDVYSSVAHVVAITQLDTGEILADNRLANPHFYLFSLFLENTPPASADALNYYIWLARVVYTTEMYSVCNPTPAELEVGFGPYLAKRITSGMKSWFVKAANESLPQDLSVPVLEAKKGIKVAYQAAQIEKLREVDATSPKIPVLEARVVFSKRRAIGNGHCGFLSAFNMPAEMALAQILSLVSGGKIYDPVNYEPVWRRLKAVHGDGLILDTLGKPEFNTAHAAEISALETQLITLSKRHEEDKLLIDEFNPIPEALKTEPTEVSAKAAWNTAVDKWIGENRGSFDKWNARRIKADTDYEQKKWQAIWKIVQQHKFAPEFLARFIQNDFFRVFEDSQLDVGMAAETYLPILQRLNLVNLNVWLERGTEGPVLIKQLQQSPRYRVINVLLQGAVEKGGVINGHYDPLVVTGSAEPHWEHLARVIRHENIIKDIEAAEAALVAAKLKAAGALLEADTAASQPTPVGHDAEIGSAATPADNGTVDTSAVVAEGNA